MKGGYDESIAGACQPGRGGVTAKTADRPPNRSARRGRRSTAGRLPGGRPSRDRSLRCVQLDPAGDVVAAPIPVHQDGRVRGGQRLPARLADLTPAVHASTIAQGVVWWQGTRRRASCPVLVWNRFCQRPPSFAHPAPSGSHRRSLIGPSWPLTRRATVGLVREYRVGTLVGWEAVSLRGAN